MALQTVTGKVAGGRGRLAPESPLNQLMMRWKCFLSRTVRVMFRAEGDVGSEGAVGLVPAEAGFQELLSEGRERTWGT